MPITVFTDEEALREWAENSADMEFLGLTPEIILDEDLMFNWVKNVFLNVEDFINSKDEKTFMDFFEKFDNECPEYTGLEFDIDLLLNLITRTASHQPTLGLMQKDNLNKGLTIQKIQQSDKELGVKTMNKLAQITENYNLKENFEYYINILPILLDKFEVKKKNYYLQKSEELLLDVTSSNYTEEVITNSQDENFNKNHWNKECFNLFLYLIDNYEKKGKIKFINIFYYLTNHVKKEKYAFNQTIEIYTIFIKSKYNIQLTTFRTAQYDFRNREIPILNGLEGDFSSQK